MKALHFLKIVFVGVFFASAFFVSAQTNIGINSSGATPNNSAILDLNTGNTWASPNGKGLLLPRMNTSEQNAIVSPAIGFVVFNTDCLTIDYWNGSAWALLGTSTSAPGVPTAGINTSNTSEIVWSWTTVTGATGYQWNTTSIYPGVGINTVASTTYTQTPLSCGVTYTLYVWAYNACGNSATSVSLSQATVCCISCGTQVWSCANVNTGTYQASTTYGDQTIGDKWCFNDISSNCNTYGGLYDWRNTMGGAPYSNSVVSSPTVTCNPCTTTSTPPAVQGICPTGYHVPSDLEWSQYEHCLDPSATLATYQTTVGDRGTTIGTDLKVSSTNFPAWDGTNASGFAALPAGVCNGSGSFFLSEGTYAFFWTSTESTYANAWAREFETGDAESVRQDPGKPIGASVRCLQN